MISIALAFLLGVMALLQFRSLPDLQLVWLIIPVALLLVYRHGLCLRFVAAATSGFLWCLLVAHQVLGQGVPPELVGEDVLVQGRVVNFPTAGDRATRFLFAVDTLSHNGQDYASPGKIRLSWYQATALPEVGERWQFLVRLKPPHGFMNPGGFDYEAWLFQHRIRATGYVRKQSPPQRLDAAGAFDGQRLRFALYEKMNRLGADSPTTGLLTALAIGERDGIQPAQWEVLRRTGTAHLMAISGLHIGLLAGLGYWLGNRGWRLRSASLKRLPAPRVGAVLAMVFALVYAAMAGFSIPTQRALIMVCVVMLALWRQRFIQPPQVLAQSLLLVLLLDPLSALSAGFWLSFAAVAVILYGLNGHLGPRHKGLAFLRMQWLVVLGLLPLTIGLFQQASLISPLANLLAIPVVSLLVVPLTLLASALTFVSEPIAGGLLQLINGVMGLLWQGLEVAAAQPFSQVQQAAAPLSLVAAAFGLVLLLSPKGIPLRYLGLVFCLPLAFPLQSRPAQGEFWLSLLDVGQGLAVVVQTQNHTLVYDTGPRFSDSFDTGAAVVAPYLRHAGIAHIDTLMITHPDNDHIGGAASLLRMFPVGRVLSSVSDKLDRGTEDCQQGQQWQWDGVHFRVLHPAADYTPRRRPRNNRSCVLHIAADNGSVLLTGDIEREAEEQMLRQTQALAADVILVPHHGSNTSSSQAFIAAVAPRLALYPVGYRNRYRLPSQKVVHRYAAQGVPAYATANSGRILLTFPQPHEPQVARYRQQAARFWHHRLP
ncbi:MAG: DNA internalization-related competence protein ComEC/Rec2 [Gammaproteobacteria bacterium]